MNDQLTTTAGPMQLTTWEDMERMAKNVADSKMFGITNASQAMCLFAICQAEGLNPITALRRYHLIEGRPSMRADAMMAEFLKAGGGVIWHVRSDSLVAATWFADIRKIDDAARDRSVKRFDTLWALSAEEPAKHSSLFQKLALLARDGEETILRTYADCEAKGLTLGQGGKTNANWERHPREMLTARNATEGIRIVMPGLVTGIVEENEARDIAEESRNAPGAPPSNDLDVMRAIQRQHRENARDATTDAEKQRFLELAADLEVEIDKFSTKGGERKCATLDSHAAAETDTRIRTADSITKVASDSAPGNATPDADPFAAGKAKMDKLVDATNATVEPPQKDDIPMSHPDDWKTYAIEKVAAYKGKKLGEVGPGILETLFKRRCGPYLDSQDPALRLEAEMIKAAWEARK